MVKRSACLWIAGALALTGGFAFAADPPGSDQPQATAPSAAVADQIDAFIKTVPGPASGSDAPDGIITSTPDRRVHGEVDVAAGSRGYRSVYAETDGPLGQGGHFSVAVGEDRMRGPGPRAGCLAAPGGIAAPLSPLSVVGGCGLALRPSAPPE